MLWFGGFLSSLSSLYNFICQWFIDCQETKKMGELWFCCKGGGWGGFLNQQCIRYDRYSVGGLLHRVSLGRQGSPITSWPPQYIHALLTHTSPYRTHPTARKRTQPLFGFRYMTGTIAILFQQLACSGYVVASNVGRRLINVTSREDCPISVLLSLSLSFSKSTSDQILHTHATLHHITSHHTANPYTHSLTRSLYLILHHHHLLRALHAPRIPRRPTTGPIRQQLLRKPRPSLLRRQIQQRLSKLLRRPTNRRLSRHPAKRAIRDLDHGR